MVDGRQIGNGWEDEWAGKVLGGIDRGKVKGTRVTPSR
jgi:hypothetical protein